MKKTNLLAILTLAATPAFLHAETTSYSDVVGYSKVTVPAGTRAVVPGFVKSAVFSGSGAISGQTVASSGLTANALSPTQFSGGVPNFPTHYLEITSGAYEGYSFDVASNTATGVTVSDLPSALNGTTISYAIRPHLTLGDIDSGGLPDGNVVLNIFNNPSVSATSYLYDSGGNWYDGSGSFLMNHAVIYPGTGISLNNSSSEFAVNFTGVVKATKTAIPVYRQASQNLVGPLNPSANSTLTAWAAALPENTVANILTTSGNNNVSLTLLTDLGSTVLYDGGGNELPSVSIDGQNAFSMSAMSADGYVIFNSPLNP